MHSMNNPNTDVNVSVRKVQVKKNAICNPANAYSNEKNPPPVRFFDKKFNKYEKEKPLSGDSTTVNTLAKEKIRHSQYFDLSMLENRT
jgi:hypothetical protein